jgi:hypothetical protein
VGGWEIERSARTRDGTVAHALHTRDAKIGEDNNSKAIHEEVIRLDVAMDESAVVQVFDGQYCLRDPDLPRAHRCAVGQGGNLRRVAFCKIEHDVETAFVFK